MKKVLKLICRIAFISLLAAPHLTLAAEPQSIAPAKDGIAPPVTDVKNASPVPPAVEAKPAAPAVPVSEQKVGAAAKAENAVRIGYVEMARFGEESSGGKAARERVKKKGDTLRSQIAAKQKQLEKLKNAFESKLPTLSPKEREAKAKEFEKKVEGYRKFVQNAEKELQSLEEELSRKLYREIEEAAASYGKANGFAAIVVKRELLYVGSGVEGKDVTEEILKLVNAKVEKP